MTTFKNGIAALLLIGFVLLAQSAVAFRNYSLSSRTVEPVALASSTGTPELVVSRLLKLYPNPNATDEVNIKGFTRNTTAAILIKNAIGYIVLDEKNYTADEKGDINLKIHSLQQGHYYISIKVERAQVIKKLIKI